MKKCAIIIAIAAGMAIISNVFANVLYVDDDADKDYTTITEAMQYAMPGDIVYLHKGTYSEKQGEKFPITVTAGVTVLGEDRTGSVIDADDARKSVFRIENTDRVVIKNLTVKNARRSVEITNGADSASVINCHLSGRKGAALAARGSAFLTVSNTVLDRCDEGIILVNMKNVRVVKNTIVGRGKSSRVSGIACENTTGNIKFNIIESFGYGMRVIKGDHLSLEMMYNNIHRCVTPYQDQQGGTLVFDSPTEEGNRTDAPKFVDAAAGDYRLREDSPCKGLGAFTNAEEGVNLFSFKARFAKEHIVLTWMTSSEKDNQGWNIYKGVNANGPYLKLNEEIIYGAGNSKVFNEYAFKDTDRSMLDGTVYFYLEQVDFDGNTVYSPMISLSLSKDETEALSNVSGDILY